MPSHLVPISNQILHAAGKEWTAGPDGTIFGPMPKVTVSCQSTVSSKEAFDRVRKILEEDQELHKLDAQYKCEFDESKLSGLATGKHFKASMAISEGNPGSNVQITVELPLALSLAKGIVQKTLQRKLDRALT